MTVTADALDLLAGDPTRVRKPGDFDRNHQGAPWVNHPTETRKDGEPKRVLYGRPSSFGTALDNPYSLVRWKERQILIGAFYLVNRPGESFEADLYELDPDARDFIDGLAARCHEAAGSSLAADRGTHVHLLCERWDRQQPIPPELYADGEALGIPKALQLQIIRQWIHFRQRLGLTALAVEQTVVNDRWRLAGTLDRLDTADHDILTAYGIIDAHCPFVGDIKTGGLTLGNDGQPNYWVKYGVQIAAYVDGIPYDTETDERIWWGSCSTCGGDNGWRYAIQGECPDCEGKQQSPHPSIALIYHYDLARALNGEPVDWQAIPVNVDAGREGGDLCRAAADFAKRRDLFAMPAPTVAAPCSVDVAGEQPVAEPEPPVPAQDEAQVSAAVDERLEFLADRAQQRGRLRARIADLIAQGHEQTIRRHWPADVAPLSKPGHTDDELAQILAAVRRVETEVGAAWHPDDGPPPHVNTDPRAEVVYPAAGEPDEGFMVHQDRIDDLNREFDALEGDALALCVQTAMEARDAGRPITVRLLPSLRRYSIARAVIAWAASGRSVDDLWFTASNLATFEQTRDPAATLGGLVSQFTIKQADRLYEAASNPE